MFKVLCKKIFLLFAAIAVSVVLFTSIPLVRNLIGLDRHTQKPFSQPRRILAEMVRTPPKKNITTVTPIHPPTSLSSGRMSDATQRSGISYKIAPDLSVEGGDGAAAAMQGQDLEAMVFDENQTDENVSSVYAPAVSYPQRARDLGINGTLEAVLTIDRDGKVIKVDIVKSPHASITEEAKRVLMTWRFKPAKIKGIPVRVRRIQDIEFTLEEE